MPGSPMSTRAMSGSLARAISMASMPSAAASTTCPSSSSSMRSASRASALSSTIRIERPGMGGSMGGASFTLTSLTSRLQARGRLDWSRPGCYSVVRSYRPQEDSRMRLRPFVCLALVALVADSALPAAAQGPIRIGASLSLSGTYAKLGKNQHEGYQQCEKELNAKGGLLGRKIQFVVYDDQSLPATAVRLYEKLITEDKVDGVMGPYSSPVTEAAANVTEKYKEVMVSPLAATTSIFRKGRKYIFMVISPAEVYLEGLVDIAAKRGLKTVAVVNEDTLFSKAAASGAVEMAKKKGLQLVLQEAYPKGNTDFSALLVKLKAANPDIIAAATYFDDAVAITRQMRELNVNPKMFAVTVGGDIPEFYTLLKTNG